MKAKSIQASGVMTSPASGATLNYILKKNGRVLASETGLKALPGRLFDIPAPAIDSGGSYTITLTGDNGPVQVGRIGVRVINADGSETVIDYQDSPAAVLDAADGFTEVSFTLDTPTAA
ncbi:hypothetical protein [Zavarzinella formosa]|uniref:hypothetical protein n=1 Tax=Zavarzinella formosa TaxID=360055 RepID=UPI00031E0179|nr:hypothetical protein [Zavarzinella formosa]